MPFLPQSVDPAKLVEVGGEDADTWSLLRPLVYRGSTDTWTVPAGFRTDFASVPRALVWLAPRFGTFTPAAILHDWLCEDGIEQGVHPVDVDGVFRRVMRELGVPVLLRWLMWCGVRWGALETPRRRRGWWRTAPLVLAISVLAAPLVVPPGLVILVALHVYAAVESAAHAVAGTGRPRLTHRT